MSCPARSGRWRGSSARRRTELASALAMAILLRGPLFTDGWFGADKLKHFFMSAFLQSVTYSVAQAAGAERGNAMRASMGVAAAAGLGREIYDARVKGRFSVPDLVWDAGGIAAATAMLKHTR